MYFLVLEEKIFCCLIEHFRMFFTELIKKLKHEKLIRVVFLVNPVFPFKDLINLFMRQKQRQAEGEVGSMQGARCGTRSQDPRVTA